MRVAGMFEPKIIHWEYVESRDAISDVNVGYKSLCVVKPGTKIKNGVLFKFVLKIYKDGKLTLNCICEQVFIDDNICKYNNEEIRNLIETAIKEFNVALNARHLQERGLGQTVFHEVKDYDIQLLAQALQS